MRSATAARGGPEAEEEGGMEEAHGSLPSATVCCYGNHSGQGQDPFWVGGHRIGASSARMTGRCNMGRVAVSAVVESLEDLYRVHRGELAEAQVRRIEVAEVLVGTGATGLSLPRR